MVLFFNLESAGWVGIFPNLHSEPEQLIRSLLPSRFVAVRGEKPALSALGPEIFAVRASSSLDAFSVSHVTAGSGFISAPLLHNRDLLF